MAAFRTSIEDGRRLIARPDLDFHEVSPLAAAATDVRTLNRGGMRVLPRFHTSEHIVHFFPLEVHLVLEFSLNAVDVGAGAAEEAEITQ